MHLPTSPTTRGRRIRVLRAVVGALVILILFFAAITFAQAWSMTHYQAASARTTRYASLTSWEKFQLLLCGPTVRRQSNTRTPKEIGLDYQTFHFTGYGGLTIEAWSVATTADSPLVLMFPGYGASKDTLLPAAGEFVTAGGGVWMVDPHGIGGSQGSVTSVGFHEAEDVAAAFAEARRLYSKRSIVLYGTSMGAVAVLRAVSQQHIQPAALVLECPFDRFTHTIGNRFSWLGLPRFPFAPAVAFWVGAQQGFNGLGHNPTEYAAQISCPTLLLQGENDDSVGRPFVREVAQHLGAKANARFELIPNAGHAYLVTRAQPAWRQSVHAFLASALPHQVSSAQMESPRERQQLIKSL